MRLRAVSLARLLFSIAAANVVLLVFAGEYGLALGPWTLAAHNLFKPLLYLNAAFLVLLLLPAPPDTPPRRRFATGPFLAAALLLTLALHAPGITVNFQHHDWTHRHISASLPDVPSLTRLFLESQGDRFYRPLGFVSLWLDFRLFGGALPAYHLQSLALHFGNGLLVALLARRMGWDRAVSRIAALLFLAAPMHAEAVLWPAARFDLLAVFFTLLSLLCGLHAAEGGKGWLALSLATYGAGLLSKESAYAAPLLAAVIAKGRPRQARLLLGMALVTAIALAIRGTIYSGIGGYVNGGGQSLHLALSLRTASSILVRAPLLSLYGASTSLPDTPCPLRAALMGVVAAFVRPSGWAFARHAVPAACCCWCISARYPWRTLLAGSDRPCNTRATSICLRCGWRCSSRPRSAPCPQPGSSERRLFSQTRSPGPATCGSIATCSTAPEARPRAWLPPPPATDGATPCRFKWNPRERRLLPAPVPVPPAAAPARARSSPARRASAAP